MAEIRPVRAWRYNRELAKDIESLTSPLFDVVSAKQRAALYSNPLSSIHLSVPNGDNPEQNAKATLENWKQQGIIEQDPIPGIYVYYQYFSLPGSTKEYCRKGFICNIHTYEWDENILLRHENTMPHSVNDRKKILAATELHVSPTHGLYTDPNHELEAYMDESMLAPIYETEDYQGVRDVLSVIHDDNIIRKFLDLLRDKQVILADGHHRYAGSLSYKHEQVAENNNHQGSEAYNYHFMYLTNTEADDLRILPTHRIIKNLPGFDMDSIITKLADFFDIKEVPEASQLYDIILGKSHTFGLVFKEKAFRIRLKEGYVQNINWKFPDEIKELDLTVMHYYIIEQAVGIPGKEHTTTPHINFDRNFADCLTRVYAEEAQLAIITQDISIDQVKKVCYSGFTMPQKSTYFYPKAICGFLFSSIKEDEFQLYPNLGI